MPNLDHPGQVRYLVTSTILLSPVSNMDKMDVSAEEWRNKVRKNAKLTRTFPQTEGGYI